MAYTHIRLRHVAQVFFAIVVLLGPYISASGTQNLGLFLLLIIGISKVSRVKFEIILLRFQLKSFFFILESQPSVVLIKFLDRAMFKAPEGAFSTGDRP